MTTEPVALHWLGPLPNEGENGMNVRPIRGDMVDGRRITKVWSTGKVDLADGGAIHVDRLTFVAGSGSGATFTDAAPSAETEAS